MISLFQLNKLVTIVRETQRSYYVVVRLNFQYNARVKVSYDQLIDMLQKFARAHPGEVVEGFIDSDGNLQVGLAVGVK